MSALAREGSTLPVRRMSRNVFIGAFTLLCEVGVDRCFRLEDVPVVRFYHTIDGLRNDDIPGYLCAERLKSFIAAKEEYRSELTSVAILKKLA
jgi:hypothetical protein